MPAPNNALRNAREQMLSPSGSGEPMSRQELAELVNHALFENTGHEHALDANHIGKWERGEIRRPLPHYLTALRRILKAGSNAELGFSRTGTGAAMSVPVGTVEDVDRKTFLSRTVALGAGVLLPLPAPSNAGGPSRVGESDLAGIEDLTTFVASTDNTRGGGGLALTALHTQLTATLRLRADAHCSPALRPRLDAAVGSLASVIAFVAFDSGDGPFAEGAYQAARICAEESGDWHLRAIVLADMARRSIFIGDPDTGLTHIETAMVRADRLTSTERAMLHAVRARALAALDPTDPHRVQAAIAAADDEYNDRAVEEDPPWMQFHDLAQHHGDTAHALADLRLSSTRTEAQQRLAYAVAHHGPGYERSRTFAALRHAQVTFDLGDIDAAVHHGTTATQLANGVRSRRVLSCLRVLDTTAQRQRPHPGVDQLRDHIQHAIAA
ncbi:helix-turn-helix domain-containing protein [Longispora urticae]